MRQFDSVSDEIVTLEDVVVNDDYDLEHRSKKELIEKNSKNKYKAKNKEFSRYPEDSEDNFV